MQRPRMAKPWLAALVAVACALASISCGSSDDGPAPQAAPPIQSAAGKFSIKAFLETPTGKQRIDFGPAELARSLSLTGAGSGQAQGASATTLLDGGIAQTRAALTIQVPGQSTPEDLATLVNDPRAQTAWLLQLFAISDCILPVGATASVYGPHTPSIVEMEPWATPTMFHIFDATKIRSCDDIMAIQEILLCAADKLASIGDAVSNVDLSLLGSKLTVPPQADHDKFIVRDMAMNALAHVVISDNIKPVLASGRVPSASPCVELYEQFAQSLSGLTDDDRESAFGERSATQAVTHFPPLIAPDSAAHESEIGLSRLSYRAHILRAGGRLLRDLIDKSVRADMAGAEHQRATSGGTSDGAKLMWGVLPDAASAFAPYNSLRHAARVLFGRLEIGPNYEAVNQTPPPWSPGVPPIHDPSCYGFRSLVTPELKALQPDTQDILDALGPGLSARWDDRPAITDGEALATSVISNLGIIYPPYQRTGGPNMDLLDTALLGREAQKSGIYDANLHLRPGFAQQDVTALQGSPQYTAAHDLLHRISQDDLTFGLDRAWDSFRLLSDAADNAGKDPNSTSLEAIATAAGLDPITGSNPLLLKQGRIPRSDIFRDAYTDMLPAVAATECAPADGNDDPFASSFFLADVFRNKMGQIKFLIGSDNISDDALTTFVDTADAELRSWSGQGRVIINDLTSALSAVFGTTPTFQVAVQGITPDWFDIDESQIGTLPGRLKLVYGNHRDAECVAGIRASCPASSNILQGTMELGTNDPTGLLRPQFVNQNNNSGYFGAGKMLSALFHFGSFPPSGDASRPFSDRLFFVVLEGDPHGTRSEGRVLAAFSPDGLAVGNSDRLVALVSDYQSTLANAAFGIGTTLRKEQQCVGDDTTTSSGEYCIPGIQRNMFVPLANELTSTTGANATTEDSWKHYLSLAQDAATQADELGKQLIDVGLQQDLRREAAQEELGQLCGDFVSANSLTIDDGTPKASDNSNANACFGEDKYDLVFLGKMPFTANALGPNGDTLSGNDATQVKNLFCNGSTAGFCGKSSFTVAALGLGNGRAEPKTTDCSSILKISAPGATKFNIAAEANKPYVSVDGFTTALYNLIHVQHEDGSWDLRLRGDYLMVSVPNLDNNQPTTGWKFTAGGSADPTRLFPLCRHLTVPTTSCTSDAQCGTGGHCDLDHQCSMCAKEALNFEQMFPRAAGLTEIEMSERIQRAMYFMGALAGNLPPGRLYAPVAAVNFNSHSGTTPVPTLFGSNDFVQVSGGSWQLSALSTAANVDYTRGGLASAIYNGSTPTYASLVVDANTSNRLGGKVPSWYSTLFSSIKASTTPGEYIFLNAGNDSVNFLPWIYSGQPATFVASLQQVSSTPLLSSAGLHGICTNGGVSVFWESRNPSAANLTFEVNLLNAFQTDLPGGGLPANTSFNMYDSDYPVHGNVKLAEILPGLVNPVGGVLDTSTPVQEFPDANNALFMSKALATANPSFTSLPDFSDAYTATPLVTQPSHCPPSGRVPLFVYHWLPAANDPLLGNNQLNVVADVLALACLAEGGVAATNIPDPPTPVRTVGDLAQLAQWTNRVGFSADAAVDALFIENIPKRIVGAFQTGQVANVGVTDEGQHGEKLLTLREKLEDIYTGWVNASSGIRQLGNAMDSASVALELARVQHSEALLDIASTEAGLDRDLAMASLGVMSATASGVSGLLSGALTGAAAGAAGGPFGIAGGAAVGALGSLFGSAGNEATALAANDVSQQFVERERDIENAKTSLANVVAQTSQQKVFVDLSSQTEELHKNIQNAISQMRDATAEALSAAADLQASEGQARFEAAKATGADFFRTSDGTAVPLPVNTVYRREYDITQRRYQQALDRAKRLAYLARLSIEQRIGVRMNALNAQIGPLPAPSLWADDVCSVQGIDYKSLSDATSTVNVQLNSSDGGVLASVNPTLESALIGQFADQFIGDYVAKLKEFMDFYNIQYPFHEADDRAVISLRERLLAKDTGCTKESLNLLFESNALYQPAAPGDSPATGGWELHACDPSSTVCMEVRRPPMPSDGNGKITLGAGGAATTISSVEAPGGVGGVSWFHTITNSTSNGLTQRSPSGVPSPPYSVYQSVALQAATHYVLSWWDTTLSSDASAQATGSWNYQAAIYDASSWQLVAALPVSTTPSAWSPRQTLDFVAPNQGNYVVVFSVDGSTNGMSFGIANVQLQVVTANDGFVSGYESTTDKRVVFTSSCGDQPSAIQNAFDYRCDNGSCFYELKAPFLIDTTEIEARNSSLTGVIGAGNYNHRHLTMAVNLVGSGVIDCTKHPTPDCYGNSFVTYDLLHDAFDVPMVDYGGQPRCFTFGTGAIRGGKALAAERYITFPVSSGDEALIDQDGILRPELAGRPLSGSYRLRVNDGPALNWQNVQDIQFILGYRVWSRVATPAGN